MCKNLELLTPHMGYNRTQNQRSNGELEIGRRHKPPIMIIRKKPILKNSPYPAYRPLKGSFMHRYLLSAAAAAVVLAALFWPAQRRILAGSNPGQVTMTFTYTNRQTSSANQGAFGTASGAASRSH